MRVLENADLRQANTFAVRARARYLVRLDRDADFARLKEDKRTRELPLLILGDGSNVLFRGDFEGVVARVRTRGVEVLDGDGEHWYVRAAAGESWHGLVLWSLQRGLAGLENLSLIPGSVGAAPVQNIGAYGLELADRFHALEAIAVDDGKARTFPREACAFGYRTSLFKTQSKVQHLITRVTLRLPRTPEYRLGYQGLRETLAGQAGGRLDAAGISEAICSIRRAKLPDPQRLANAGSFFKNPTVSDQQFDELRSRHGAIPGFPQSSGRHKLSAAWLIEACGWKGYRRGDAGVYPRHALVLVNYGSATGQQIWRLARDIRDCVGETFGVRLEPEVTVV